MQATNHVAGGIVFTGIFASFWNINIFSDPILISTTTFFSLLPDIDHTKSLVGKAFYPIAKEIDRRYGHRTITHSMLALLAVMLLLQILEHYFFPSTPITVCCTLAFFSHLIFDMMTLQGIPFFYPFKKNPCVIPGNPAMRLRSSDQRANAMVFTAFLLIGLSCYPLMKNGFWMSYSRTFGTQKHVATEFRRSDHLIAVEYTFKRSGETHEGTGYCLYADDNKTVIYDDGFISLDKKDETTIIEKTKPLPTDKQLVINETYLNAISIDSLNQYLKGKIILTAQVQADVELSYTNMTHAPAKSIKVENVENIIFESKTEEVDLGDPNKKQIQRIQHQLILKRAKLAQQRKRYQEQLKAQVDMSTEIAQLNTDYTQADWTQQELILSKIKKKEAELNRAKIHKPDPSLITEIHQLEQELRQLDVPETEKEETKVYAVIKYILIL